MTDSKTAGPDPVAAANARALAVLDDDGVLIGRVDNPSDAEWTKARPECRFVNGFDNALHRYRLVMWKPDRWRFEAVMHPKDDASENLERDAQILAPLARAVIALADGKNPSLVDLDKLVGYLKTFDAKGN